MENISLSSACLPSDGKRQIDFVLAHEPPSPFMIDELLGPIKHVVGEWTTIGDHHVGKIVEKETKFVEEKIFCEKGEEEAEKCSLGRSSQKSDQKQLADERARHRHTFERNLQQMGLQLERARALHSDTNFVLIHAPLNVLLTQAELLQIKMPVRKNDVVGGTTNSSNKKQQTDSSSPPNSVDEGSEGLSSIFRWWFNLLHFGGELQKRLEPAEYFSQPFVAQHLDCFVGHENPETFFSQADRSRMVYNLLCRARYDSADELCYGIERLVQAEAYNAAYPLHDELYGQNCSTEKWANAEANYAECSDRQLLYQTWVRLSNFRKYQPLDLIKHYYGTKIGFYYAWLGYYTRCLYPITVIGIFCVAYGFMTASNDVPSNEICSQGGIGTSLVVCPTCEYFCDFTPLIRTCFHSKLTYLFDNNATVLFAIIMSIWTTLFLEGWKRYHAKLAYKWNTLTVIQATEQEALRPEFQHRQRRINPVTGLLEPWMPVLEKSLRICCSAVTIVFFMFLVVAYLVGTIFYAIVVRYVFAENEHSKLLQSNAMFFTFISAALINLIFILLMNFIYNKVAMKLTEWECPRTQSEFDNSYTLKVFLFQFVNYFSYIFYIAFIKGRFTTIPTDRKYAPHALLEQCEAAGCMVELVIQLAVIMIGQQILSAVFEIVPPIITQRKEQMRLNLPDDEQILMEEQQRGNNGNGGIKKTNGKKKQKEKGSKNRENKQQLLCPVQPASKNGTKTKGNEEADDESEMAPKALHQYELDYSLNPVYPQFIFDEYLKMVIQLGFVTMFAAAFPLAPLFALLNNIFEIRLDAYKFTIKTRRPVAESVRDIGIWYQIINMISYISVLVNAFLIAFTSDFVPRLYYAYNNGGLQGYVDDKFSYFDATALPVPYSSRFFVSNPQNTNSSVAICRYLDYRLPPCSLNNVNQTGETIFAMNQQQKQLFLLCSDNYELQPKWWTLFALRLLFVLVFELSIFIIKAIIAYLIPDLPSEVCTQLQREQFLMRQAILEREIGGELIEEKEAALIGKNECQLPPKIVENVEQSANDEQPSRSARTKRSVMFESEEETPHQSTVPHSQQMFLNAALGVGNGLMRLFAQRERPTLSSLKSNRLPGQNNWEAQTMMTPTSSKSAPTTTTMMWIDEEEGRNGARREKNKK